MENSIAFSGQGEEQKRIVLDEIKVVFGDKEKINASIYFLCELENNWILVEIRISKNYNHYTVQFFTHPQQGILQWSTIEDEILAVVRESIVAYDPAAKFADSTEKQGNLALVSTTDQNISIVLSILRI